MHSFKSYLELDGKGGGGEWFFIYLGKIRAKYGPILHLMS